MEAMFRIAETQIGDLVPHSGEEGRLLEEFLRNFLRRILPERFAVGTGLIFDSENNYSSQTDIVIYDRFFNGQILTEFSSVLFPIECVYAVIEVKKHLQYGDVQKCIQDIGKVRAMARRKRYTRYRRIKKGRGLNVVVTDSRKSTLAPRSFVFAYTCDHRSAASLAKAFSTRVAVAKSYIHGAFVLGNRWLVRQKPSKQKILVKTDDDSSLAEFCMQILNTVGSISMEAAYLEPYMKADVLKSRRRPRRRRRRSASRAAPSAGK
jgi:hypothetical protein